MPTPECQPSRAQWVRFDPRTRGISALLDGGPAAPLRKCAVLSAGIDILEGHFLAGTPCSGTHLVWIVTQGQVRCDTGSGAKRLSAGQTAICPAGGPHWIELAAKKARGVWFHLQDNDHWAFLKTIGPSVRSSAPFARLGILLEGFIAEAASTAPRDALIGRGYAEIVAWTLQRELEKKEAFSPSVFRLRLEGLWKEVELEPAEPWTVERLCGRLRVSGSYLHRMCRLEYGTGPMSLVASLRIGLARTLLLQTNLSLDAIAERVGYGTSYALSHAFLRHTGYRPGAFRQGHLPTPATMKRQPQLAARRL